MYVIVAGWGSHSKDISMPYLTAAASIGMKHTDVDMFIKRLQKVLTQLHGSIKEQKDTSSQNLNTEVNDD